MPKPKSYTEKYRLLIDPTVLITRAPNRERIDLKRLTMEQADRLFTQPGQKYLALKEESRVQKEEI